MGFEYHNFAIYFSNKMKILVLLVILCVVSMVLSMKGERVSL